WSGPEGVLEVPPLSIAMRAEYRADTDAIDLDELVLTGPLGTIRASGRLDNPAGQPRADLTGTLEADWEAIRARLADLVDSSEIYVDGGPLRFHLAGPLDDGPDITNIAQKLLIETQIDLTTTSAYGLHAGPM